MTTRTANLLANEKSPYLLQHRFNPVQWYPWSEEAFAAAREQDKPIFLSIGYSTCYWCHVMERDSFERDDVAETLDREFICIKVDREERPDIDQIYMDVVVGLTGHGGWPMSVFLTPDGKPFWGGTFFWRAQFLKILEGIATAWSSDRAQVMGSADSIAAVVAEEHDYSDTQAVGAEILAAASSALLANFDPDFGGFGGAPKFPPSQQLRTLIRHYIASKNPAALHAVNHTLDCMLRGGIYDQLGGGFARYSTDERWLVPHFEKMLYDNALLTVTLLDAFTCSGAEHFKRAACETLDFMVREMRGLEGGFFSALDAGEVDREGEFYVFDFQELGQLCTADELAILRRVFDVCEAGNFEGKIVLSVPITCSWTEYHSAEVTSLRKKLLAYRDARPRPHTDDKVLTSWNGLALEAFAKAARLLNVKEYLEVATAAAQFLYHRCWDGRNLSHRYRDGESMAQGFLEDYAYLVEGLISLYEAGFEERWLLWAYTLQKRQDELFWDAQHGGYFVSNAQELIARKKELMDGALPAAQSVAYKNLLRLNGFFPEERFDLRAEKLRMSVWGAVSRHPAGFSSLLLGVDFLLAPAKEIAIVVPQGMELQSQPMVQAACAEGWWHSVLAVCSEGGQTRLPLVKDRQARDGKATAYVCANQICREPMVEAHSFKKALSEL